MLYRTIVSFCKSTIIKLLNYIKIQSDKLLEILFSRKGVVYAFVLAFLLLFIRPIQRNYDKLIVSKYLNVAESSLVSDVIFLSIFLLTALYFLKMLEKKRPVNSEFLFWTIFLSLLYVSARFSGHYRFLSFEHLGLSFLYYADWIILFAIGHLVLKMTFLRNKRENPIIGNSPFVADTPILTSDHDLFGRKIFAAQIADKIESINNQQSAVAIGINGPWGSGKTSFINMVIDSIDRKNRIIIYYQPWKSKSATEIIKDFFDLLIQHIAPIDKELSFSLKEYADKLVELDDNIYAKSLKSIVSYLSANGKAKTSLYNDINERIDDIGKQIIIVVDDLDRLDKGEVIEVIRLIRNTADFKGLVFVVCYDKGYILNAIKSLNEYNHEYYLEKIFQFEFVLPVFDYDILKQQLVRITEETVGGAEARQISTVLYRTIEGTDFKPFFLKTQRDIIRFANSFFFELRMLEGEIDLEDLFMIHLLKLKFQRFYELLIEQKEYFFILQTKLFGDDLLRLRRLDQLGRRDYVYIEEGRKAEENGSDEAVSIYEYVFEKFMADHREELNITIAEMQLLCNFMRALFVEKSFTRQRYVSTNEVVYAQSFDKYFAYTLLKNNLSTLEFDKARKRSFEDYVKYISNTVESGKAGPLLDKLFLVKDFKNKQEFLDQISVLHMFANQIFATSIYDAFLQNYDIYVNELYKAAYDQEILDTRQFVERDILLYPNVPVPFFQYDYCQRNAVKRFTGEDLYYMSRGIIDEAQRLIKEKDGPPIGLIHVNAFRLVETIMIDHSELRSEQVASSMQRVYLDFWNFNRAIDYGFLLKETKRGDISRFSLDAENILLRFWRTPDSMKAITNADFPSLIDDMIASLRHLTNDRSTPEDSYSFNEFVDFLGRLKFNSEGVMYDFHVLKPGRLLTDLSNISFAILRPQTA